MKVIQKIAFLTTYLVSLTALAQTTWEFGVPKFNAAMKPATPEQMDNLAAALATAGDTTFQVAGNQVNGVNVLTCDPNDPFARLFDGVASHDGDHVFIPPHLLPSDPTSRCGTLLHAMLIHEFYHFELIDLWAL